VKYERSASSKERWKGKKRTFFPQIDELAPVDFSNTAVFLNKSSSHRVFRVTISGNSPCSSIQSPPNRVASLRRQPLKDEGGGKTACASRGRGEEAMEGMGVGVLQRIGWVDAIGRTAGGTDEGAMEDGKAEVSI